MSTGGDQFLKIAPDQQIQCMNVVIGAAAASQTIGNLATVHVDHVNGPFWSDVWPGGGWITFPTANLKIPAGWIPLRSSLT